MSYEAALGVINHRLAAYMGWTKVPDESGFYCGNGRHWPPFTESLDSCEMVARKVGSAAWDLNFYSLGDEDGNATGWDASVEYGATGGQSESWEGTTRAEAYAGALSRIIATLERVAEEGE